MSEDALDDMSDVARGCFGVLVAFVTTGLVVTAALGIGIVALVQRLSA